MNIQAVAAPNGEPVRVSWSLWGSVHEATPARVWKIAEHIRAAGLLGLVRGCDLNFHDENGSNVDAGIRYVSLRVCLRRVRK